MPRGNLTLNLLLSTQYSAPSTFFTKDFGLGTMDYNRGRLMWLLEVFESHG